MSDAREAIIPPPFVATAKQDEAAAAWADPACRQLLLSGAIRSGKTQAAGRLLVEEAVTYPATYLVARLTYRELEDSTKKAMLHGDGDMPPLIPPELIANYRKTDNLVELRTGGSILFRSLDEPGKLLNLTLAGVFVDQIEELDEGDDGERLYDTLLGRLSDSRGRRKLVAVANPASTIHFVYRRMVAPRTRDESARSVHFRMDDNAANLDPGYVAAMVAMKERRPHWYRTFVLGEWGAIEGAAFEEFDEQVHVVDPFKVPDDWDRFESLDHGASNPTAALAWATDHDGNSVVYDAYYSPGLVSAHAAEIKRRRSHGVVLSGGIRNKWKPGEDDPVCWADPSIAASQGLSTVMGRPASVLTEYREHGLFFKLANNDRAAGYMRLLELLHVEPRRIAPPWSRLPQDAPGAPRLYVFEHVRELVEQFKGAPVATDGVAAGEAVDAKWESAHGHAIASARYGALTRPAPTPVLEREPDDPRQRVWVESTRRMADPDFFVDEEDEFLRAL